MAVPTPPASKPAPSPLGVREDSVSGSTPSAPGGSTGVHGNSLAAEPFPTASPREQSSVPPHWRITGQLLDKGRRPSVLRFREFNLPRFDLVAELSAKPARPARVHVEPKTLLPQTPGRDAEEVTVQTNSDSSRPPPPERSTPRLGGPRPPVSSPNVHIAERPPPPERSTPRLGAARLEPNGGASDDGDTTVLTDRRKQQLVAQANEEPDESLYDIVGANTHRNLQVAADETSRRVWAAAVAAQKRAPRVSTTTPDTRWVPGALVAAGVLAIGLGVWVWQGKLNRPEVSIGTLPASTVAGVSDSSAATAPIEEKTARAAGQPEAALPEEEPQTNALPNATVEVGGAATKKSASAAKTQEAAPPTAAAREQASSRPAVTATASAPVRSKKSSEQSIFTDAPF